MARKALTEAYANTYTGTGTGSTVESGNAKINDNFEELDYDVVVVDLTANNTTTVKIAKPVARTLSAVHAKRHTAIASALGTVVLTVKDGDANTLLVAASTDAEAFTASFVSQSLTATTANLAIAAGEPVVIALASDNADATGGPAIVRLTWAAE